MSKPLSPNFRTTWRKAAAVAVAAAVMTMTEETRAVLAQQLRATNTGSTQGAKLDGLTLWQVPECAAANW